MHIEEQDSLEVFYYLGYELERGMEWMLYNEEGDGVKVPGIFCFATQNEMVDFKEQYPVFAGNFKGTSIEPVLEGLAETLELNEGQRQAKAMNIQVADCKLDRPARQHDKPRHNLLPQKINHYNAIRQSRRL